MYMYVCMYVCNLPINVEKTNHFMKYYLPCTGVQSVYFEKSIIRVHQSLCCWYTVER